MSAPRAVPSVLEVSSDGEKAAVLDELVAADHERKDRAEQPWAFADPSGWKCSERYSSAWRGSPRRRRLADRACQSPKTRARAVSRSWSSLALRRPSEIAEPVGCDRGRLLDEYACGLSGHFDGGSEGSWGRRLRGGRDEHGAEGEQLVGLDDDREPGAALLGSA